MSDFFSSGYKASEICIEDDEYIITLTPTNFYKINVNDYSRTINNQYIIMYTMIQTNKIDSTLITASFIPYYLSAGHTNYFRANLLLPFISFNLKQHFELSNYRSQLRTASKTIPVNLTSDNYDNKKHLIVTAYGYGIQNGMGLLFKNMIIENTNLKTINDNILKTYNTLMPGANYQIKAAISTVLIRMNNLLDFIIAIQSRKLNEEYANPSGGIYRPYDLKLAGSSFDFTNINDDDDLDGYRELIAEFLHDTNQIIKTTNIIIVTNIHLPFEEMDMIDFNTLYGICSNTPPNVHKPERIEAFTNYGIISEKFFLLFKTKINLSSIINKDKIIGILMNETTERPVKRTILANVDLWQAECQRKYLKYKNKYLQLKNKLK